MTNRERSTNYHPQTNEIGQETNSLQSNEDSEISNETEVHSPSPPPSQTSSILSAASRRTKRKSEEISDLLIQHQANRERLRKEREEIKSLLEKNNSFDEMDTFFLSMSKSLKKLSPYVQLQTKRKIFNAILEAEELEIRNAWFSTNQNQNCNSSGYTSAPGTSSAPGPNSESGSSSLQISGSSSTQAPYPSLEGPPIAHLTDEEVESELRGLREDNLNSTYEKL